MSGITYEFTTKDGLIFDSGKWGIQHISTKIENQTFKISLSFIKYEREKKYYPVELVSSIKGGIENPFVKINDTEFEIRIKRVILNTDLSQILIVEIIKPMNDNDISKCLNCNNNKIVYTYVDYINTKSFCSKHCLNLYFGPKRPRDEFIDEDDDDKDEPKLKKQKIINKENIDILLIGLDHGEKEKLLSDNLIKSLNSYSEYFNKEDILVKQPTNEYNITKRKPFLIFWESKHFIKDENILISDLNGLDSKSWNIPAEDKLTGAFQFLETAYFLFLFPVDYDKDNKAKEYLDGINNIKSFHIQERLRASHGMEPPDIEKYGLKNPTGLEIGLTFLTSFVDSIVVTMDYGTEYLESIIPNKKQCTKMIHDAEEIIFKIISTEAKKKKIDDILSIKIKELGKDYKTIYDLIVPQNIEDVFYNNNIMFIMTIILKEGELYHYFDIIKKFILETWSVIAANVNPDLIEYGKYNNLNFFVDDNDKNIEKIDDNYFVYIIEKLKTKTSNTIPTLIYTRLVRLLDDGLLLSYNKFEDLDESSPFLQFRDIVFFQNMTNICLSTNIKRCIVLYGSGHIGHINEIVKNQKGLDYNLNIYHTNPINDNELFNEIFLHFLSDETKLFIREIRNKILLYLFYEKIDKWLWETEQIKEKISDKDSEGRFFVINPITKENELYLEDEKDNKGKKIRRFIKERPKFQLMVGLTAYFLTSRPDDSKFADDDYYTIGYYIYFIIREFPPTFNFMINNYTKQYDSLSKYGESFKKKINPFINQKPPYYTLIKYRKIGEHIKFLNTKPGEKFNVYDKIKEKEKQLTLIT